MLRRLGSAEVELGILFPGEAQAAVDLDALAGDLGGGFRAVGFGETRLSVSIGQAAGQGPGGVVGSRAGALEANEHVGVTVEDLEDLVVTMEDDAERKLLVSRLNALIEVKKAEKEALAPEQQTVGSIVIDQLAAHSAALSPTRSRASA